jgi:cytochrome o ubiquinol oxidase subunit III
MEADKTLSLSRATMLEEHAKATDSKAILGFWIYLMTDCVLFASLFAVFVVLRGNTFGGPSGFDIFRMPYILGETVILLTSSFTCGLGTLAAYRGVRAQVFLWFGLTFLLGLAFLILELKEFAHLDKIGDSWRRSGFLSSYFTLVGTHGLHITVGLVWMLIMMIRVAQLGLSKKNIRQLTMLGLFWHFLDIIWIFIFTIVYLMGVIPV